MNRFIFSTLLFTISSLPGGIRAHAVHNGQILLENTANIWLTQNGLSTRSVFGQNDVEAGRGGWDIEGAFPYMYLPDPSGNYWGGADMSSFNNCPISHTFLTDKPTPPTVYCSDIGITGTKSKSEKPLTVLSDTPSCQQLFLTGQILASPDAEYTAAGDTLKYYVEHCYSYAGFNPQAFEMIEGDFGGQHAGGDTLPNLLQWFFNVLYLNTDTSYYCNDAMAALGCFEAEWLYDTSFRLNPLNGASGEAAVENYLIESGKCPSYESMLQYQLNQLYVNWHRAWKDTVTDSLLTPWDTSNLPTLQQIGFEALLGQEYVSANNGVIPSSVLGSISASPDPFENDATVTYTMNVPATLTAEVYNDLGQRISVPVPSVFTIAGDYSLTLQGSSIAAGTYYVRFSVPEGEVQTIKIVKE